MERYEYEKYVTDQDHIKEMLEKYGVAIIPNILDKEECYAMYKGMWESMEHATNNFRVPLNKDHYFVWNNFVKGTGKDETKDEIKDMKYEMKDEMKDEMYEEIWNDNNIQIKNMKIKDSKINITIETKTLPPLKEDDKASWSTFTHLYPLHNQLIQHHTLTHSQYYWNIRQNEKIVDVFAHLWGVKREELLVSFDGLSLCLPPETVKKGWHGKDWLHVDQSYTNNKFDCVQSWVTAKDINKGDSTLTFLESSHLYHKKCAKKYKITDNTDWYKLNEKELKYYEKKGCTQKSIMCPAGSLVLWDSRLVHAGQNPLKERKESNTRCIVYVCYTPRNRSTPANIKKRINAFETLRTTNHNPHKCKLFNQYPRTYNNPLPFITNVDPPVLNDLGKKLVGY